MLNIDSSDPVTTDFSAVYSLNSTSAPGYELSGVALVDVDGCLTDADAADVALAYDSVRLRAAGSVSSP